MTLEGKRAVVVGRSNIVGRPIAMLLEQANATVTLAHVGRLIFRDSWPTPMWWSLPSAVRTL